ncbi:aldo/keto reductase [Nocardiopsis sp. L17-MgMaSL7]|uniref:aldo/keto reductase n=1 Tax=Nocardiopsis sp. L17-MgMaSL7 TaxID=1938893 RepID=UPI000D719EFC|nr:aldo/keto reductase [Nocardiopsis sp. L17-MgMaSL7]PWV50261.1 diketogulonate reductase-like aldo/keto reductase [Nocardiopsis sp. L17-MgMaSL7]
MQYVTLNNGLTMPQLGFGVWQVPDDEAHRSVSTAIEAGYRSIDTARVYDNEKGTGRAIAESGVAREDIFLTTKLWNDDQGYDRALRAFDASLDRLGTDYVDLYLIHWPTPAHDTYVETWKALERVHAEGRARAIGVSNFTAATLERLVGEAEVVPAINQIELHPYFSQSGMRAANASHGLLTEAWSPLGQGKGLLDDPVLAELGAAYGKTAAQVALRWHLQLGNVVIPKSVTPARIRENFDVFDFELTAEDIDRIGSLDRDGRIGPDPDHVN